MDFINGLLAAMANTSTGIPIGIAIGVAVGAAWDQLEKKKRKEEPKD